MRIFFDGARRGANMSYQEADMDGRAFPSRCHKVRSIAQCLIQREISRLLFPRFVGGDPSRLVTLVGAANGVTRSVPPFAPKSADQTAILICIVHVNRLYSA